MSEAKTYGLTHLAIAVNDIERTLKFYAQVFDMQTMYHEKGFLQLTTPGSNDILVFEEKKTGLLVKQAELHILVLDLRTRQILVKW
jgi:catechol 2,3-dioxygenase-like lactoylglutathione lyase family enzyme